MRKHILIIVAALVIPAFAYLLYKYFQAANIHPIKSLEALPMLKAMPKSKSLVEDITSSIDKITASLSGVVGLALLFKEFRSSKKKKRAAHTPKD
jgi:hypothetical protein